MTDAIEKAHLKLRDCDASRAEMLVNEIGKVRAWLTGFQAAGKAGPPGEDALRQVQVLLKDAISEAAKPSAAQHAPDCDWHHDQYAFECTCGLSAPNGALEG